MTRLAQQLEDMLGDQGWEVVDRTTDLEWWADEQWSIRSVWSPVGILVYVTFLVDPQHDGVRRKGEAVWAMTATHERPTGRENTKSDAFVEFRERNLDRFIAAIGAMRDTN